MLAIHSCFNHLKKHSELSVLTISGSCVGFFSAYLIAPHAKCHDSGPVYPIVTIALGALGLIANFWHSKTRSSIPSRTLEQRAHDGTLIRRIITPDLSLGQSLAYQCAGASIAAGTNMITGPAFLCALSSQIYPIVLIPLQTLSIGGIFYGSRQLHLTQRQIQDTDSVTDTEAPTSPVPTTPLPDFKAIAP